HRRGANRHRGPRIHRRRSRNPDRPGVEQRRRGANGPRPIANPQRRGAHRRARPRIVTDGVGTVSAAPGIVPDGAGTRPVTTPPRALVRVAVGSVSVALGSVSDGAVSVRFWADVGWFLTDGAEARTGAVGTGTDGAQTVTVGRGFLADVVGT